MKTIEFHILQNFPPSNLNRDDSGAPKDCDFGGYRRQRISSQCIKRSVRQSDLFRQQITGRLGMRTRRAPGEVARMLVELGHEQAHAQAMSVEFFDALYGVKEDETSYLLYVGPEELQRASNLLHEKAPETKPVAETLAAARTKVTGASKAEKEALTKSIAEGEKHFATLADLYKRKYPRHVRAVDVALFGRMLADNPAESIDAACQVSHAISVNRMNMEFDYFTAVDDLPSDDNAGAAMIGTVGFASSCFYRFACINWDLLVNNLGKDAAAAREGVLAFAESFVYARPSGKQNTFAAHSLPGFLLLVVRDSGQPVSLANAFEKPVIPSATRSLTEGAIDALSIHYSRLKKMFGLDGKAFCVLLDDAAAADRLKEAQVNVRDDVPNLVTELKMLLEPSVKNV